MSEDITSDLNLPQYDAYAARYNMAYSSYRSIYETRLPPPTAPTVKRDSFFIPVALCIMIFASVAVSGSRTVLEFGGGLVGVSAFIMLEGAIVTYAFFRTRINFNDERIENVRTLANRGLALSFIVAVVANVHSVIKSAGIETHPVITLIILILVAISAPTLAFISGDIMALELMRNGYKERKAHEAYQSALEVWENDLNAAWQRENKSRWGLKLGFESQPLIQSHSNGIPLESNGIQPTKSTLGHSKEPDATPIVLAYFAEFPDMLTNGKPLEIAKHLGVGKSTVYSVRAQLLKDKQS